MAQRKIKRKMLYKKEKCCIKQISQQFKTYLPTSSTVCNHRYIHPDPGLGLRVNS